MTSVWYDQPGETPVADVPADYYPTGCGSWFEVPDGRDAGKRLFVRDSVHGGGRIEPSRSADADPDHTVVFVHGNPECSYTYRHVITNLLNETDETVRVVAMDHVGFGLSDTADHEMVCMDHAENLAALVPALDLKNVTLVVHDWGGPIGVGAFLQYPELVSNLVLCNSTVLPMPADRPTYTTYPAWWLPWARTPDVIPDTLWGDLASYVLFHASPTRPARLYGGWTRYVAARRLGLSPSRDAPAHRVFRQQFRDPVNVRSSKRLVRQTPYWGHGNVYEDSDLGLRDTGPFYGRIRRSLGAAWGPRGRDVGVRAVVGRWDPCGKPSVLGRWQEGLPQLSGHVTAFEDVGHFVEEERPRAVASAIRSAAGI
ncbi:alpha/beta hydrolase [Halorientalis sp.]|uniref:alpha/beta hydrolase n=1 Tax=Halorientalis sp. TaxID=1931229 RepID=UPI00262849E4|nr:alpha/beta fold hydrolase [Halorientalis sp.]